MLSIKPRTGSALWITTTSLFIALLIGVQLTTRPFGQLVTGSLVNLLLVTSVMTCGISSGLTVAIISPILASLLGISPLWALTPTIITGNMVYVIIWFTLGTLKYANKYIVRCVALVAAALCKFTVLYLGVVQVTLRWFLSLPEQQASALSTMFAAPQLITALVGGAIAMNALPIVETALTRKKQ